jgi:hypothetical protein
MPLSLRLELLMLLHRSDYDQAARYLQRANEFMERAAAGQTQVLRRTLDQAIHTLCSDDHYAGDVKQIGFRVAATVTVLRAAAAKVPIADARTEVLKAAAVLRDRFVTGPRKC